MSKHYALCRLEQNGDVTFVHWYKTHAEAARESLTGNGHLLHKEPVYVVDVFNNKPDVEMGEVIGRWSSNPNKYQRQVEYTPVS